MRQIPLKNYFIYLCICLATFLLLFVFVNRVSILLDLKESVLNDVLYEITDEDLLVNIENYSIDNPTFFLYVSNGSTSFEQDFKEYIISNNLNKDVIYFNGFGKLRTNLINQFRNNLFRISLKNVNNSSLKQSNLYFFKNGEVVGILYNQEQDININDVKNFIERLGEQASD